MALTRRRMFQAAALAGGAVPAAPAQQLAIPLSEERQRVLAPVLAQRRAQLQKLRDFAIDDRIGLTPGVLDGVG